MASPALLLYPDLDLVRVKQHVAVLAELARAPELLADFEARAMRAEREKGARKVVARRAQRKPRNTRAKPPG